MPTFNGSCHCGDVSFAVVTEVDCPIRCNCSFCSRRGAIVQIIDAKNFTLVSGSEQLLQYGKQPFAKHNFCRQCGIHTFTRITEDDANKVAVNLNYVTAIDTSKLTPMLFDGAHLF